jgi:NADPH:quinone reductase-like Zn-dependent oxidoreductase
MTQIVEKKMAAVLLKGHGGFEQLEFRTDIAVPVPGQGEVLIKVGAAGVNNTDINTRIGWYSKSVASGTTAAGGSGGLTVANTEDASWAGATLAFPRIQGADVCGEIVSVGPGGDGNRQGERVLVEPCLRQPVDWRPYECWFLGSECDGGFAQYTKVAAVHAHTIKNPLSDAELASFPCAYSTAENMLTRTALSRGETVLVTGASGGVGSAAVQLAKRRKAQVIAVAGAAKADEVRTLGADQVIPRGTSLEAELGSESVDVVIDLVAGPQWPQLLQVLRRGGRYAVAGAIAGPMVELDVRTLYLKDLRLIGCTVLEPEVFRNLVGYIERNEIKPIVSATYPLDQIVAAQKTFLSKKFTGKIVLEIPQ